MTDHELEQRLRGWYRAQVPDSETVPAMLRSAVAGLPEAEPIAKRGLPTGARGLFGQRLLPVALAAATILAAVVVGAALFGTRPSVVGGPTTSPAATGSAVSPSIVPAPAGRWRLTGPMNERRWSHEAVLLADGSVLVAGGVGFQALDESARLASAEVYEPDTEGWTPTGSLSHSRSGHTLTRLDDGRVLAVGGHAQVRGTDESLASAELYDPASGTWELTGQMSSARSGHVAVLLGDGEVLVTGGYDSSDKVATAELYDPSTGSWTQVASMFAARAQHGAALLGDGTVVVMGGAGTSADPAPTSAEQYDPATGTWSGAGRSEARHSPTMTVLPDGRVLVTGGMRHAEIYDPRDGSWSAAPGELFACFDSAAILLPGGTVLDVCSERTQRYDPATGAWSGDADLTTDRTFHTATLLPDGRVLVAGGLWEIDDEEEPEGAADLTPSAEIYKPVPVTP